MHTYRRSRYENDYVVYFADTSEDHVIARCTYEADAIELVSVLNGGSFNTHLSEIAIRLDEIAGILARK